MCVWCRFAELSAKAEALQDERDFLVVQLSIAEEERAAAAQNAAVAAAEVQHLQKLNQALEVRTCRPLTILLPVPLRSKQRSQRSGS